MRFAYVEYAIQINKNFYTVTRASLVGFLKNATISLGFMISWDLRRDAQGLIAPLGSC